MYISPAHTPNNCLVTKKQHIEQNKKKLKRKQGQGDSFQYYNTFTFRFAQPVNLKCKQADQK